MQYSTTTCIWCLEQKISFLTFIRAPTNSANETASARAPFVSHSLKELILINSYDYILI